MLRVSLLSSVTSTGCHWWTCLLGSTVLGSEHRAHWRRLTFIKSISDCLARDIHTIGLLLVNLLGSSCSSLHKGADISPADELKTSMALSSSPKVYARFLELVPCSCDCAGRQGNPSSNIVIPSWRICTTCATSVGCRYCSC